MYIKSNREIELMRSAGKIVAEVLERVKEVIQPGITTKEINQLAEDIIRKNNAKPAFLGYGGYPASVCTSVNEEVVHGIPGSRVLKDGDIVGVDVGAYYKGYCGDAARTFEVGNCTEEAKRLIRVAEESFFEGIKFACEGNRLYDISHAIQTHAESNGFSVVRSLVGHGIGKNMHEEPQVPNYGLPHKGPRLTAGLTLAIEPMINGGKYHVRTLSDGWTVVTSDGSLSAHYENTIVITANGPEILTKL